METQRDRAKRNIMGSSGFWSDKVCYLRLGFLRNVTRRYGEDGGLLKQSNGSHGGTVGAQSDDTEKIKDVRKQYHCNKNYTFCGLMTDLGLTNEANL